MISKDQQKHFKDKHDLVSKNSINVYNNFTLNKNHECSTAFDHGRLKSLQIGHGENSNYGITEKTTSTSQKNSISLKKFHKNLPKDFFNTEFDDAKDRKGNFSNSIKSSSTLSLHIAAYENSPEAGDTVTSSADYERDKELKKAKLNFTSSTFLQDRLEFPRQQEDDRTKPEVQQFLASQRLFFPVQQPLGPPIVQQPAVRNRIPGSLINGYKQMEQNGSRNHRNGGRYHVKKYRTPKSHPYQQQKPNRKFPDRWTQYPPLGQLMPDTRFIAFKTPLAYHFFEGKDETPFMISDIIKEVEKTGKKLGLVFDLTATTRYYEASEWSKYGVEYKKIECQGHNIHRQPNVVEEFISIADEYLKSKDENYIVGVHCTHGINRTGFLICRYLMQKKGWEAAKAIASFEVSRGIKIERDEYINSLLNYKASGTKFRRRSLDGNDTTWRNSSTSWRNSDASSSWRPSSSSNNRDRSYYGSRSYSLSKTYRSKDSWVPTFNHSRSRDIPSHSSSREQQEHRNPVEEKKCQEATKKLRGMLNIGERSKE